MYLFYCQLWVADTDARKFHNNDVADSSVEVMW